MSLVVNLIGQRSHLDLYMLVYVGDIYVSGC